MRPNNKCILRSMLKLLSQKLKSMETGTTRNIMSRQSGLTMRKNSWSRDKHSECELRIIFVKQQSGICLLLIILCRSGVQVFLLKVIVNWAKRGRGPCSVIYYALFLPFCFFLMKHETCRQCFVNFITFGILSELSQGTKQQNVNESEAVQPS